MSLLYAETVSSAGSAWYVGSFKLCYESGICGLSFMWKASCGMSSGEYCVPLVTV